MVCMQVMINGCQTTPELDEHVALHYQAIFTGVTDVILATCMGAPGGRERVGGKEGGRRGGEAGRRWAPASKACMGVQWCMQGASCEIVGGSVNLVVLHGANQHAAALPGQVHTHTNAHVHAADTTHTMCGDDDDVR
jgi:hypothetical protein